MKGVKIIAFQSQIDHVLCTASRRSSKQQTQEAQEAQEMQYILLQLLNFDIAAVDRKGLKLINTKNKGCWLCFKINY